MKKRFDLLVHEKYPQYSRRQIQSWIMQGKASANGKIITKVGMPIVGDADIILEVKEPKYVSRAGLKLEKALEHFGIELRDLIALDAGLSTGGFTDCLLQHGVQKVYGVDVGYGQVHEKIRNDQRVIVMEKTNLRNLEGVGQKVDIITLDLSFISVLLVMDAVTAMLKKNGALIVLIKPQFEAEKHEIGRGGIVKNDEVHEKVIEKIILNIAQKGFAFREVIPSPILGAQGNKEFLAYFVKESE